MTLQNTEKMKQNYIFFGYFMGISRTKIPSSTHIFPHFLPHSAHPRLIFYSLISFFLTTTALYLFIITSLLTNQHYNLHYTSLTRNLLISSKILTILTNTPKLILSTMSFTTDMKRILVQKKNLLV